MKYILLTISLIFGAMSLSAGSHSKDYEFPKKDCQEMLGGIGDYLRKQIKNGLILKRSLRVHLMPFNTQLRYNGL